MFPLTPLQTGMLYESTLAGAPWVNLEQIVVRLHDDPCDEAAMRSAWTALTARHGILRSRIDWVGAAGPRQQVLPDVPLPFDAQDWTWRSDPEAALAAFLKQDRLRGAEPSAAPAWRVVWARLAERSAVLIWTFPHTHLDGRSFAVLLEEVFAHYDARVAGLPARVFSAKPDFADHCRAVAAIAPEASTDYFRTLLAGFDRPNSIGFTPLEPPSPGSAPVRKALLEQALSGDDTETLEDRAARAGVTLATMVLAAWGIVLARCSGQADAVFGVTRSGRYLVPDAADMVGCLITTVPARVRLDPDLKLDSLLRQVRADQLSLHSHEHVSLGAIKAQSDLSPDQPLFETLVMFERQTLAHRMSQLGGRWSGRTLALHEEGAQPMMLAAYGAPSLLLQLEHDPTRITAADAARYFGYLTQLLRSMTTAAMDSRVADLQMLPASERARLQCLGQPDEPVDAANLTCLATAFEAQAARSPEAFALGQIGGGPDQSYAEIDRAANRLAHFLRARGIGAGSRVGLCLPRSPDFVVAMLAVWKAGAAFVPMDPSYPAEVLSHVVSDSGVALILARQAVAGVASSLLVDPSEAHAEPMSTPPDRTGLAPDRLAYVIYTSGTTGRPKGVMVSHRALAAHAVAATQRYALTAGDRVLQFASLSFDVSLEEIVPTLVCGAKLVLRSEEMASSPSAFSEGVGATEITLLNLPTGFWQVMLGAVEQGIAQIPSSVRLVIVGGERVPAPALIRWQRRVPAPVWMNGYGPTETTITATSFVAEPRFAGDIVPVGRPMGHCTLAILAADGALAPEGAIGELVIGGPAVALGYLGQPARTAIRFRPDPSDPARRIHRSGDLARWRADGQLLLGGRVDRQIKLRGYRIEPAEVERVLEDRPDVGKALVAVVGGETTGARLIGWVQPADRGQSIDLGELAAILASVLPPQMCPHLVEVDDWPQTPGGKTDMARLPAPDGAPILEPGLPEVANTATLQLTELCAAILGLERMGPDQSFFEMGGHSLLLVSLIGQIEARFGRRLTLAQVHDAPTPRRIAALLVDSSTSASLADCILPIQPKGARPPIYGVHVLGINGSYYRPLAAVLGPDQPVFGLTVGLLSKDTPTSIAEIAELYLHMVNAHRPTGPIGLVAVSLGSYVALELAQRLVAAGREVNLLAILDAAGPGGRQQVRGFARLHAHMRKLSSDGLGHIVQGARRKLTDIRHAFEVRRLAFFRRKMRAEASTGTVEAFVAANELAVQEYRGKPYARRLTIIRAEYDVFDRPESIASGLGWEPLAAGGLDLIDVPGDHLSIMEEPHVARLAEALLDAIDRAGDSR